MYVLDQDKFINGVCEIETTLDPIPLLNELQAIEVSMGRKKIIDKGPRNIDLDVLLYDNETIDHERLKIPHLGILEREFVLRPLAELVPGKSIDSRTPWKLVQDHLNALPSSQPISTVTPLRATLDPIRSFKSNRKTHIMHIANITPDSFSDGQKFSSQHSTTDSLIKKSGIAYSQIGNHLKQSMLSIVDVGGQSSAPGANDVTAEQEMERILPLIKKLTAARSRTVKKWMDFAISVDTYRASVAEAAVLAGADIINDISAGKIDADMLPTMAKLEKTVVLMHMRGTPESMNRLSDYPNGLIPTVATELLERVAAAEEAGIRRWRIILDPGIGFAKTMEHNLEILRRFDELRNWPGLQGLPWLVGSSRKNFIGKITKEKIPDRRLMGSAAAVVASIQGGADIVRVHDTKEMWPVVAMSDAIWRNNLTMVGSDGKVLQEQSFYHNQM